MHKQDIDKVLEEAVRVVKDGGVILYPTDTIWGIGCDATNPDAVARIYSIKRRDDSKSLVLLAADLDQVAKYVKEIPPMAIDLVEVNDRPMTLIYPGAIADKYHLAPNVVAADGSVGIRIPMMDFCRRLAARVGRPIVSTSANISGEKSPGKFKDIPEVIVEAVDYVVDPRLEAGSSGQASQIIRIGLRGEVEIIRG